jgi:inner membrane protein
MDNVTHSLAAVLLAEAVCAARRASPEAPRFRAAALAASLLANNLPDLDFAYRRITPGKLGYLLHHRGHTHTLLGAFVLSVVAFVLVLAWSRLRGVRFDAGSVRALAGVTLFGSMLHIGMDFQNNYGVHPFWPVDDRWFYGDTLFIVEPLLWSVSIPIIAVLARTRIAAVAVVALFLSGLAFGARARAVPASEIAGLLLVAVAIAFAAWRLSRPGRVWFGIGGWVAVTACFAFASRAAARIVATSASELFPTTHVVDTIRTPAPGNPLCWSVISVGRDGARYVARRGVVSLAPSLLPVRRCPSFDTPTATAPLAPIEASDGGVLWRSKFSAPLSELRALAASRCDAAAFLRYSRAPFWTSRAPVLVGDLRFDRSRALEFAEMELSEGRGCPPNVPPWTPPRADLLSSARE